MDELLYRQMPHSLEAEQAVLGSMLIDANCIKDVMEKLRPEDFYLRQNREIFETIYSMFLYSKPIDGVTVAGEMERAGLSTDDTRSYLVQLMEVTPTSANVMEYVRIVREKALLRAVAAAASDITAMVQEGAGEASKVLEAAEQKIYAIRRGRSAQGMVTVGMVLGDVMSQLAELSANGGRTVPGLSTGLSAVDAKINGMNKSDLLLLAARPGMGKTSFALNIATNVARLQKIPTVIFSLEMTCEQLTDRILSSTAGIDSQAFRTGRLNNSDWNDFANATSLLYNVPIYMDDSSGISVPEIKAKIRQINQDPKRDKIGLVIIDYLQLMQSAKRTESRVQEISDITRNLKIMAKELNVPVIALSQLSRAAEKTAGRSDHRPQLSDLRDSGSIEQDADVVLFLYRAAYYNSQNGETEQANENEAECIVAKNRHGETSVVRLGWDGAHTRFSNLDEIHEQY